VRRLAGTVVVVLVAVVLVVVVVVEVVVVEVVDVGAAVVAVVVDVPRGDPSGVAARSDAHIVALAATTTTAHRLIRPPRT